jgi:hypothetical protein
VFAVPGGRGGEIEFRAFLPDPEIVDPIDQIYSSKKEDQGEEGHGRSHNTEAHRKNDHCVEWCSIGN